MTYLPESAEPGRPGSAGRHPPTAETPEERVARRSADQQLVAALRDPNISAEERDRRFKLFRRQVMGYAYPVMMRLARSREIFKEIKRYRTRIIGDPPAPSEWDDDDRHAIVVESIILALNYFERVSLGEWDPGGGAALSTYFVSTSKMHFASALNTWRRERALGASIRHHTAWEDDDDEDPIDHLADRQLGPEDTVILQDQVSRTIEPMSDPRLRHWVGLRAVGYSKTEAYEAANLTRKAVDYGLQKHRRALRANADATPSPESVITPRTDPPGL